MSKFKFKFKKTKLISTKIQIYQIKVQFKSKFNNNSMKNVNNSRLLLS